MSDITNETLLDAIQELSSDVNEVKTRVTNIENRVTNIENRVANRGKEIKYDVWKQNEKLEYVNNQIVDTKAGVSMLKKEVF